MQFTIGRSTHGHHTSGQAKQVAAKPDSHKQIYTKQNRYGKSQPFDPDDLRQRLYVVIAEQEASKEKQRRERQEASRSRQNEGLETSTNQPETGKVDTAAPNLATTKPEGAETSFAARMARSKDQGTGFPSKETAAQPSEAKIGRSMSKSIHDKLRRRPSIMEPATTESTVRAPTYHYVPQEAASQFARTATSSGMLDKHLVHSLSQSALKFHIEGRISDQIELDSSTTPAQQNRALKKAQSYREKLHERNQFQHPRMVADERGSSEEGRHLHNHRQSVSGLARKPSRRKNSFGNIPEDETLRAVAADSPINELASEETLVVDPAAANEHRVDWTQSDESCEKPRAAKNPLLRKADSIWTLKGRFGNFTKNSQARDDKRFPVREKHMDGSTPPSPPKSHKTSFFARLRR
ncbi:hypothetical protein F4818DRAFT_6057 [Hypoxylon cercidicola]|nr:hypothetical protein F4818DRAFT_6057 [Hypoxylon cercidicola]